MKHSTVIHCLKAIAMFLIVWLAVSLLTFALDPLSFRAAVANSFVILITIIIWFVLMIAYIMDAVEHSKSVQYKIH